jgi:hypothetical protein
MPHAERNKSLECDTFFVSAQYVKSKKLSTHMPHAERNKSHELEVCGSNGKITISKNRTVI